VRLRVRLQPRASRNRLIGQHEGRLKIALTAPPVEGEANAALLTFLAALLQIPRSSLRLLDGEKSRNKEVGVRTAAPAVLIRRLEAVLSRVDKTAGND
jgi:uncharacterized protein (TIGR00251 family)